LGLDFDVGFAGELVFEFGWHVVQGEAFGDEFFGRDLFIGHEVHAFDAFLLCVAEGADDGELALEQAHGDDADAGGAHAYECDACAARGHGDGLLGGGRGARAFEERVCAVGPVEFGHGRGKLGLGGVEDCVCAELFGQGFALGQHFGDADFACAGLLEHHDDAQADGA